MPGDKEGCLPRDNEETSGDDKNTHVVEFYACGSYRLTRSLPTEVRAVTGKTWDLVSQVINLKDSSGDSVSNGRTPKSLDLQKPSPPLCQPKLTLLSEESPMCVLEESVWTLL